MPTPDLQDPSSLRDLLDVTEADWNRVEDIISRMPHVSAEDKAFLDALTPKPARPCGDCTLCCITPAIAAKDVESPLTAPKPPNQACDYCDLNGGGCSVYERRPSICKGYLCFYSLGMIDTFPMDGGVCWTGQPPAEPLPGDPNAWVAVGHATDASEAVKAESNRRDIQRLFNMGASLAVLRDDRIVIQILPVNENPYLLTPQSEVYVRTTPIDPADPFKSEVDESKATMQIYTLG